MPDDKAVDEFMFGPNGVAKGLRKGSLLIDCSTIGPVAARRLFEKAKETGHVFVDAPVSGGVRGAEDGRLTFMIGAPSQESGAESKLVLGPMGANFFDCGGPSMGQTAKVANNLALGIQMQSIIEAMVYGERMGMDLAVLKEVMSKATSR